MSNDTAEVTERMAIRAYAAYGDDAHWRNFAGGTMPQWDALPEDIREHWRATVRIFLPEHLRYPS